MPLREITKCLVVNDLAPDEQIDLVNVVRMRREKRRIKIDRQLGKVAMRPGRKVQQRRHQKPGGACEAPGVRGRFTMRFSRAEFDPDLV
jgi:hypothetical protein